MSDLFWIEHLERLNASIIAQTERARAGSAHPTIKGASIEIVVRRVLSDYLPSHFQIGTGQIANNQQQIGPQSDVLIYDKLTFPRLAVNEDHSVIVCCESLYSLVECKAQWKPRDISNHFRRFVEVESKRHEKFHKTEDCAGYFVFVIDSISCPELSFLEGKNRFIGVYSLKGRKSWSSAFGKLEFDLQDGNALSLFMGDVLRDCMRKNFSELGDLENTREAVFSYFKWNFT